MIIYHKKSNAFQFYTKKCGSRRDKYYSGIRFLNLSTKSIRLCSQTRNLLLFSTKYNGYQYEKQILQLNQILKTVRAKKEPTNKNCSE